MQKSDFNKRANHPTAVTQTNPSKVDDSNQTQRNNRLKFLGTGKSVVYSQKTDQQERSYSPNCTKSTLKSQ